MSLQTISLSALQPGRGNPRKVIDRDSLEGLAASIRNDGLLQNLVVSPVKGKGEHYRIVSDERRYRALKLLQERGEVDEDFGLSQTTIKRRKRALRGSKGGFGVNRR